MLYDEDTDNTYTDDFAENYAASEEDGFSEQVCEDDVEEKRESPAEMSSYLRDWKKRMWDAAVCSGNLYIDDDTEMEEYS